MKQIGNVAALPGIVHVSLLIIIIIIIIIRGSSQTLRKLEAVCAHSCLMSPQRSIGLPDVHSGYGFAIGNMAAFDMNDLDAVVSPGTFLTSVI